MIATIEIERAALMPNFVAMCCKAQSPRVKAMVARRKIYICSPYRGDTETNIRNARRYARFAYDCGYHPIAPHLYYPLFLDDDVPEKRAAALEWGGEILAKCREVWAFGRRISDGMRAEIYRARINNIPVRYFTDDCKEVRG
jgi:hypothetical protein